MVMEGMQPGEDDYVWQRIEALIDLETLALVLDLWIDCLWLCRCGKICTDKGRTPLNS